MRHDFLEKNAHLRPYSYYGTGGEAAFLYRPSNLEELAASLAEIASSKIPYFFLGGGTNSLVLDERYDGAVVCFDRMSYARIEGQKLIAGAGAVNSDVCRLALGAKLSGISWMYRLPGQLGGTVRMNARCYGGEISQVVTRVRAVDAQGVIRTYQVENDGKIFRGYKDTVFMENREAIGEVEITLKEGLAADIEKQMLFCEQDRTQKGQFLYPTCGCVFKNNYKVGVPSGMLLEEAGAHELSGEKVALNPSHANFVFNKNGGSKDIIEMTVKMREKVYEAFGVWMEYEMEVLGDAQAEAFAVLKETRKEAWKVEAIEKLRQKFSKATSS